MTRYNSLNVKLSNSQLNKGNSEIKNGTEVFLEISSNVVGDSNDKKNFPHTLLLTNTQVSKLRKAFAKNSSAKLKLSKTQLHKIGQSRGFLCRLFGSLLKTGLPLIGNILKPLAKSVLIPLGLTAAASATDAAIHKKMFGSGCPSELASHTTTLIIFNEGMTDIMKVIESLKESCLLIKGVRQTGPGSITAGEGTITAGHLLTNFEIQEYYQNEPKFNSVCSRNNLPKIKDGAYVINLDEY